MNGSKGGKAKAAKAKAKAAEEAKAKAAEEAEEEANEAEVKPPSKTDFRNMAKHICKEVDYDADAYEIDSAYDEFVLDEWSFMSIPLPTNKTLFESVVLWYLTNDTRVLAMLRYAVEKNRTLSFKTIDKLLRGYSEYSCTYKYDGDSFRNEQELLDYFYAH